jgi:hypothetical protein
MTTALYIQPIVKTSTICLMKSPAQNLNAKTKLAEKTRKAMMANIRARAGTWNGDISGEELLRVTRPLSRHQRR